MRQIEFDELRAIQLEILKKVDEYCISHSINYSLAYGTLIGAVRHKGYIPWDDDIDIMMPRMDYDSFLRGFNGAYTDLKVVSPESFNSYYAPYANVYYTKTKLEEPHIKQCFADLGVKIDVFPVDVVPDDYRDYTRLFLMSKKLNKLRSYKVLSLYKEDGTISIKNFIKRLVITPMPFSLLNYWNKRILKKVDANSRYVDIILWTAYPYKRFSKELIQETTRVRFENIEVNIAKGYDQILSIIYGDYMKLPPVEKQIAKHDFVAYWKG